MAIPRRSRVCWVLCFTDRRVCKAQAAVYVRAMSRTWTSPAGWLGRSTIDTVSEFGRFGRFLGQTVRALADVGSWSRMLPGEMARVGVASLPIALFIAGFTGIVLALQASYTFTGAVPLYFVGVLVGKTMLLELGPVLTGLALAGRVGANIAAELGTMRVTEQIDALETLAYDPVSHLVVPRIIAGVIMFPIVVAFANALGLVTGWYTAINMLDLSSAEFIRGLRLFFVPFDVAYSLIKAASFGLAVTAIGCYFGFHTRGGAEAVGRSTTQSVVLSSMLILVLDAFWAVTLL
jgi:phospholipid/cholesterol/gamma-HCH transport system permease protein